MLKLTKEREQLGWSRAELARRAKMSNSDVGKIESGRVQPYPKQLAKIARALGVRAESAAVLMEPADASITAVST